MLAQHMDAQVRITFKPAKPQDSHPTAFHESCPQETPGLLSELGVTASQDSRFGLGPGFLYWGARDVSRDSSDGIFLSDFAEYQETFMVLSDIGGSSFLISPLGKCSENKK